MKIYLGQKISHKLGLYPPGIITFFDDNTIEMLGSDNRIRKYKVNTFWSYFEDFKSNKFDEDIKEFLS